MRCIKFSAMLILLALLKGYASEKAFMETIFIRSTSKPTVDSVAFDLTKTDKSYSLRITNGPQDYQNVSSAVVWLNGEQVFTEKDFNQNVGFLERDVSLQYVNTIKVMIKSRPGSAILIGVYGEGEKTMPIVEITSPADGYITNQSTIPVSWTVDGAEQTDQLTEALEEGVNKITRSYTDAAGNTGTASITVTLKTAVPVVEITSPADGYITNQPTIPVSWTVDGAEQTDQLTEDLEEGINTITRSYTDAAGNTGKASITVTLKTTVPVVEITSPADGYITNQSTIPVSWTVDGAEQTDQLTEALEEGVNTITRSYTDAAGNTGTASITVTLKTTVPVVEITSPVDGYITNQSTIPVSWTVDGAEQTEQLTEDLEEGVNTIARSYTDAAGNTETASITVTLKTKVPVVEITSPVNGYITNQSTIPVSWTVDGAEQAEQLTEALEEGVNTITRSYTDAAGNTETASITVTLKTTVPVVEITSPVDGYITNQSTIPVSWTVDGAEQAEQLTEALEEGINTITRSYTDSAGNTGTASITATLKTTVPVVEITYPADGLITNQSTIPVSWTVDGVEQTEHLSEALEEGINTITRSYTDVAGNTGTASINLTLKTTVPAVEITCPADGYITNQSTVSVSWTVDGVEQTDQNTEELSEGANTITRTFTDMAGNIGVASITVTLITLPPVVEIIFPQDGSFTNQSTTNVVWRVDGVEQNTELTEELAEGENTISRSAVNVVGETGTASIEVFLDTEPPVIGGLSPQNGSTIYSTRPSISGTLQDELSGIDPTSLELYINGNRTNEPITISETSFSYTPSNDFVAGTYEVLVKVWDNAGNYAQASVTFNLIAIELPPDPVTVAPSLDNTVVTDMKSATEFLYTGNNPVQRGMSPETIEPRRVAVIKGMVLDRDGNPLPGVRVSVHSHPQFGYTLTRADGMFDLAVNGGGLLTLEYKKAQYLDAQRQVRTPWQDYVWAPEVVLVQFDPVVTPISLVDNTQMQVARGSVVSDNDGTRQATMFFPPGIQVTNFNAETINVRATEYTVGDNGPEAMPAELPSHIAYTYCVELSVDGAEDVKFNKPMYFYLENFLDFPVGGIVPTGYYDKQKAAWIPSDNGIIIDILSVENGIASIDIEGNGQAAQPEDLEDLDIGDEELAYLASLYTAGQSLWRVPMTHFTPWDCNWPYGPPLDAVAPMLPEVEKDLIDESCITSGSIIEDQHQVLGQAINISGTPFDLHYSSERTPGRKDGYNIEMPLIDAEVPNSLKRIEYVIEVAGKIYEQSFSPSPNLEFEFTWDGIDSYGRNVQGKRPVTIDIGYVYDGVYHEPADRRQSFGHLSGVPITGDRERTEVALWQKQKTFIGNYNEKERCLGGWAIDNHHFYGPTENMVYLGNGRRYAANNISHIITTVAGIGRKGYSGDGGPAIDAQLNGPSGIAVGPDGSFYISDARNHCIRRVDPHGIITTIAGTGETGYSGDGGPATYAELNSPKGIDIGADGSIYFVESGNHCIRRIGPDGIITTFAGGRSGYGGDGGPATDAAFYFGSAFPSDVAVGPDGSVYVSEYFGRRIRRIDPDGIITTIAGNGEVGFDARCDGSPATEARFYLLSGIAVGPDGAIYVSDIRQRRVRRIGTDGIINTIVAGGNPRGITIGPDGSIYIAYDSQHIVRRIGPDGTINTFAGIESQRGYSGDGGPATDARFDIPADIAVGPDGNVYVTDSYRFNNRVRKITSNFSHSTIGDVFTPSEDGRHIFHFNPGGKHLRTVDALNGTLVYEFIYNDAGHLVSIVDADSNITTIERDANGNPTAIVAPFGQRTNLTLNSGGYIISVTNAAEETVSCTYHEGGLMATFTDANNNTSTYTYDDLGRLIRAQNASGGYTELQRERTERGYIVRKIESKDEHNEYETSYFTERLATGEIRQVTTTCCGEGQVEAITGTNGSKRIIAPDSTISFTRYGPDPRFGMQAPVITEQTVTTPSGLTYTMTSSRTAELEDPGDLFSVQTITDSVLINGQLHITIYDAQTKNITSISPEGRQSITTIDDKGRVVLSEVPGVLPVEYEYDSHGRVALVKQGSGSSARQSTILYNSQGYMESITDALGRSTQFNYDLSGRITRETLPDGRIVEYTYDANSNMSSLTPPGRPDHSFDYTSVNMLDTYTPPNVGAGFNFTRYNYNLNKQLTTITRPDGQTIDYEYDHVGRLVEIVLPNGQIGYLFNDTTNNLVSILSSGADISYVYDGSLLTATEWTGGINGSVGVAFNDNLQLVNRTINNNHSIDYAYDNDGLLVSAGDLNIDRDPQNGRLTGSSLGTVSDNLAYNSFGDLVSYTAGKGGAEMYSVQHTETDKLGRIVSRTETVEGESVSYHYNYDLDGQLTEVYRNGSLYSSYGYDSNGNRISYTGPRGNQTGTYDNQDRMLSYGANSYMYTDNGELLQKTNTEGTTHYNYDVLGNLLSVTLPDGTVIEYITDGRNRRIGRKVNGSLVSGYLYQDQLNPVAELDASGNVISAFVYGTKINVPDYIIKAGIKYRIISDHLGSVRLVVNAQTGEVAQRIDYDEFGYVLLDSNPGFQPFGFAGGLYDYRTGLVRFGARDYDAEAGRWTAKDPIRFSGGDGNLFRYCGNDPLNYIDPNGKIIISVSALVGTAVASKIVISAISKTTVTLGIKYASHPEFYNSLGGYLYGKIISSSDNTVNVITGQEDPWDLLFMGIDAAGDYVTRLIMPKLCTGG
ncbi:RHS repeat-associated core domain-containing protein [Chitinispirillales bacterium ANBcel5]|uniref:NHL domain-containing protein n=1 Tax=Cellulosispirillum alkaliphilum TaxID=3039283 RepID=UPI002A508C09|nr:RHS repeat-associated core domain-containing protein [Chitinispirillales bacterium ANBcel5]